MNDKSLVNNDFNNNELLLNEYKKSQETELEKYQKSNVKLENNINKYLAHDIIEKNNLNDKIDNLLKYITLKEKNNSQNDYVFCKYNDFILIFVIGIIILLIIDIVFRLK